MTAKTPRTKRSAKSMRQRDDRAYAEFERLTQKLGKSPKPALDPDRAEQDTTKPR